MNKKLNFIVDTQDTSDEIILDMVNQANNSDDVTLIFGEEMRIARMSKNLEALKVRDVVHIDLMFEEVSFNYFEKCTYTYDDLTNDTENDIMTINITNVTRENGEAINLDKIVWVVVFPNEIFEKYYNGKKILLNETILFDRGNYPENVYLQDGINEFICFSEDNQQTRLNQDLMTMSADNSGETAYRLTSDFINENEDEKYTVFEFLGVKRRALFDAKENDYFCQYLSNDEWIKYNSVGYLIDDNEPRLAYMMLNEFGLYLEIAPLSEEHTVIAPLIDGVYQIQDILKSDVEFQTYCKDGIIDGDIDFEPSLQVKKLIGGISTEEREAINQSINDIKDLVPTAEKMVQLISNNEDAMLSLAGAVMNMFEVNIIASDGETITTSLTFDEEKNSYVLDYDTTLLDGSDYTIEMKLS